MGDNKGGSGRPPPSEMPTVAVENLIDRTTFDPRGFAPNTDDSEDATRIGNFDPTAVPKGEPVSLARPPSLPVRLPPISAEPVVTTEAGDSVQAFRKADLMALAGQGKPFTDSAPTAVFPPPLDLSQPAALAPLPLPKPASLARPEPAPAPPAAPPPPPPPPKLEAPVKLAPIQDQSLFEGFESLRFKGDPTPPPKLEPGLLVEQAPKVRPVDPADVRVTAAESPASPYTTFDIPPALQVVLVPAPMVAAPPKAPIAKVPLAPAVTEAAASSAPKLTLPSPGGSTPPPGSGLPKPKVRSTSTTPKGGTAVDRSLDPVLPPEEPKKKKKERATKVSAPREGLSNDELASAVVTGDAMARAIPLVLMAFTVLAAIAVSIKLFSKDTGPNQTHVQLRFLPMGKQDGPLVKPSMKPSRFEFDTVPPGLLVLYENEVLGRTPFSADLQIELSPSVAAEISSPYYEAWVGELQKGTMGEYKIFALLKPK
ncbi:MAG: hypothetical protein IPG45_21760 [Deltaproteobacteria bacterium]|nr:hypothetical protein [Deltaproteobacteria bacterium]